jgi:hypothetical protein
LHRAHTRSALDSHCMLRSVHSPPCIQSPRAPRVHTACTLLPHTAYNRWTCTLLLLLLLLLSSSRRAARSGVLRRPAVRVGALTSDAVPLGPSQLCKHLSRAHCPRIEATPQRRPAYHRRGARRSSVSRHHLALASRSLTSLTSLSFLALVSLSPRSHPTAGAHGFLRSGLSRDHLPLFARRGVHIGGTS